MNTISFDKHNNSFDYYHNDNNQYTLIFVHGGGLVEGDKSDAGKIVNQYLASGIDVISVNYRLFPKARINDYIDDVYNAIKYAIFNNFVNKKIALYGASAGAYILMMMSFKKEYADIFKHISSIIYDSGQTTTHFRVSSILGIAEGLISEYAPLHYLNDLALSKDINLLFVTCDHDMLNRKQENIDIVNILKNKGYNAKLLIMKNESHCSYIFYPSYIGGLIDFIKERK